jgi:EpsI family protein
MSGNRIRFAAVAVMLIATTGFLESRSTLEETPTALPLAALPAQVGPWQSVDRPIASDVRELLGPGNYLDRAYWRDGERESVDLFIGYLPSQRFGNTVHSPKHCLPGSGWEFVSSNRAPLQLPGMKPLQVNEAIIAKGAERLFVLYWYQAHGRGIASEYWARFYLAADAIRMNRTDGALVRLITPILPGETMEKARSRAIELASQLSPRLKEHIPE